MTEDGNQTIGVIPKNVRSDIVVSIGEYRGHKLLDVRIYTDAGGKKVPTKQGVSLAASSSVLLVEILQTAIVQLRAKGWIR